MGSAGLPWGPGHIEEYASIGPECLDAFRLWMQAVGEQLAVLAVGPAEPAAPSGTHCVIQLLGEESRLTARPRGTLTLPPAAGAAPTTLRMMLPEALAAQVPPFPQRADAAGQVLHPLDVGVASPLWFARSLMEQMRRLPPQCRRGILRPLAMAAGGATRRARARRTRRW